MRAEFSDLSYGARSPLKQLARTAYLRWFYRRVDRFCFPGEMGKAHLLRHGVPAAKLFFSPYSVDDEQIQRQQGQWTKPAARKQLGLAADDFVFLLSGKLIARKNPLAVVEAIRRMPRSERVALVVIGDGELRANFEAEARRLLGERLLAPGFVNQSQLGPYFVAADALLMPSLHETWGLVVNEAMHFGLPVIVSDRVGCHPNLVREGETGFVYDAAQPEQLAGHMQRLVDDPAAAAAMGHRAREQMVHYTIDASARGVFSALGL